MSPFKAIVYGIVQGLSEFLPISSTAHLRVVPALLGWDDPGAAYSAIIQIGTTAAILFYFAKDILRIIEGWFSAIARRDPWGTLDARMGWCVIIGTVPVVVAGLLFKHYIEHQFRSLYVIALAAIGASFLLALAEKAARHSRDIESVTLEDGIGVGLAQALAIIPGASRSGMTLTGGLFLGLKRDAAARFSFLLSIPATLAAGLFELRHAFKVLPAEEPLHIVPILLGTAVSFMVGLAAIAGLLRFLRSRTTLVFIFYRVFLGLVLLVCLWRGIINP